jgi:hypothetical protein
MKLASVEEVRKLLEPQARKRRDYDELGPNLYHCWLLMVIEYLEKRQARKLTS